MTSLKQSACIAAVLVLASAKAALADDDHRHHPMMWQPSHLAVDAPAGSSQTVRVALKNSGREHVHLGEHLRVVPKGDASRFITVMPVKFPRTLKPGEQIAVQVTIAIPAATTAGARTGNLTLSIGYKDREGPQAREKEDGRQDGEHHNRFDSLPVTLKVTAVPANRAPVADAGRDMSVAVGYPVTLDGSASKDPDADLLTYRWVLTSAPAGSLVTLTEPTSSRPSFTPDRPGTYAFSLVVNDGWLDSPLASVNVLASAPTTSPPTPAPSPQPTPKQKLQALEEQGVLPRLDRSSDLQGPDTDGDGIRDDVAAYIDTLPIATAQRPPVRQLARAVQSALLTNVTDAKVLREVSNTLVRAVQCVSIAFPDARHRQTVVVSIEKVTANTVERAMQYIKYNNALTGSVFKVPSENTCEN